MVLTFFNQVSTISKNLFLIIFVPVFFTPTFILFFCLQSIHPLIRTSQVSLSSNPDADFRYSSIFTQIGIYKGRVFAIKKVYKKSIDITREMKKELKMVSKEVCFSAIELTNSKFSSKQNNNELTT